MKAEVRAALVQFAPAWLDATRNAERMASFAADEARAGAHLVLFPELANIGFITPTTPGGAMDCEMSFAEFSVQYREHAETVPGPTTDALVAVCREYGTYVVVGIAEKHPRISGLLYNSAVLLGPSGLVGVHHKAHIPLTEKHFFAPGSAPQVWDTEVGRIGLAVCYDGVFPEFSRLLALGGAEIVCNIWAITKGDTEALDGMGMLQFRAGVDRLEHRAYTRAQENQVFYLCCSRAGNQGSTRFLGHSAVAAPWGWILATAGSDDETVIHATLSAADLASTRAAIPLFRDRRPDLYGPIADS